MTELTQEGQRLIDETARRHNISPDGVRNVLEALLASGGSMAQFSHPDLGGMGQWSRGGMIMIGDMFNNGLKSRVDALCNDLSQAVGRDNLVAPRPHSSQWQSQGNSYQGGSSGDFGRPPLPNNGFFVSTANWWPAELGMPASSGSQDNMRYACFPERQRLAVDMGGQVGVYDTGLHWISGFSQQQGSDTSATFTSQYGTVRLDSLPLVSGTSPSAPSSVWQAPPVQQPAPQYNQNYNQGQNYSQGQSYNQGSDQGFNQAPSGDVFANIERLANLRDKGYISDAEFAAKKTELLQRL
jgi:hypothetical protein